MYITARTHGKNTAHIDLSRKLVKALSLEPRVNFAIHSVSVNRLEFIIYPLGYFTGVEFVKMMWTNKKNQCSHKTRANGKWIYDMIVDHGFDTTQRIPVILTPNGFAIESDDL